MKALGAERTSVAFVEPEGTKRQRGTGRELPFSISVVQRIGNPTR